MYFKRLIPINITHTPEGKKLKQVPGYDGYYCTRDGEIWSIRCGRFIRRKTEINRQGYEHLHFYVDKKHIRKRVHSVVLETWLYPRPKGYVACHNNGNKLDNRLENLRWDNRKNNEKDKEKHGTKLIGEKHHQSKLTIEYVRFIIYAYRTGEVTLAYLASLFNITKPGIWAIVHKKNWKHVWSK